MTKIITPAIAATLMATASIAFAQPGAPARQSATLAPTQIAFTLKTGQLQASQIIGSTVYDVQNQNIGSVKDVLLDRGGKVDTVVLDVGSFLGMGGKYVGVALNDIKMDNDRLTLDRSKDQLKAAPEFKYEQAENTTRPAMTTKPASPPATTTPSNK